MAEAKSITRDNVPIQAHQRFAEARLGKIPDDMKLNSISWDENFPVENTEDGRGWIEWLFDVRFPQTIAEFVEVDERRYPFTTMLAKGIDWDRCEELIHDLEERDLPQMAREEVLILLDLVKEARQKDRDLKHVRLARRPQG